MTPPDRPPTMAALAQRATERPMIDNIKNLAARRLGQVLASDVTLKVLSNRQVQGAMLRAINVRAEARDLVESRLQGVATALDLVTHEDVASLKRTIRDMEDQIDELREELNTARAAKAAAAAAPAPEPEPKAARKPAKKAAKKAAAKPAAKKKKKAAPKASRAKKGAAAKKA